MSTDGNGIRIQNKALLLKPKWVEFSNTNAFLLSVEHFPENVTGCQADFCDVLCCYTEVVETDLCIYSKVGNLFETVLGREHLFEKTMVIDLGLDHDEVKKICADVFYFQRLCFWIRESFLHGHILCRYCRFTLTQFSINSRSMKNQPRMR